ncbi:PH domain-containing protein [Lacticaseibacillus baoqingensis]|uniref:PH domain-containing protein n=1 Tax=Lacticaseibacillus baoqingensis TaxID=2486013 RepID=A0ABW4ECG2_9LACO|nr:PH domain-containing protein [Lacticaseibacillus baoqingensis]
MQAQLPHQIKTVWRARAAIDGIIWLAITAALLICHHLWQWPWWLAMIPLVAGILHVGSHLLLIPYRYRFWRYAITADAVYLRSGYLFRTEEAIPIARIQNVTLAAGPLLQWQSLQAVQVHTASTTHSIAGVTGAVADQLREQIMQLAKEARADA